MNQTSKPHLKNLRKENSLILFDIECGDVPQTIMVCSEEDTIQLYLTSVHHTDVELVRTSDGNIAFPIRGEIIAGLFEGDRLLAGEDGFIITQHKMLYKGTYEYDNEIYQFGDYEVSIKESCGRVWSCSIVSKENFMNDSVYLT